MGTDRFILVVEDEPDEVLRIQLAFRRLDGGFRLIPISSGSEAIAYLTRNVPYTDPREFPIPDLMLLDLRMPEMDGFAVLKWVRDRPETRGLPVIVLTSSTFLGDATQAYKLGANSFLTKELDTGVFVANLKHALDFWLPAHALTSSEARSGTQAGNAFSVA